MRKSSPLSYWTPGWPLGFGGADVERERLCQLPELHEPPTRAASPISASISATAGSWAMSHGTTSFGGHRPEAPSAASAGSRPKARSSATTSRTRGCRSRSLAGSTRLKYNSVGIGNPFTQFDSPNNAASGYSANVGVEFQADIESQPVRQRKLHARARRPQRAGAARRIAVVRPTPLSSGVRVSFQIDAAYSSRRPERGPPAVPMTARRPSMSSQGVRP